uniref:Ig-like domain-containing protein n=1 Tax=Amphiprion ocellaris TaxID=80972 RepID=A0AAQ5XLS0_AMPOC
MAATQWPFLAAVLLLLSSGLHCSSSLPTCPQSCNCRKATLLNCSSSGLSSVPQLIQDSVTELDLSHNLLDSVTLHRPHRNLRNVRLGNNTIAHLSLCIDRNLDGKYLRGRRGLRPWSRGRCVPWAPTLQLLSVERNLLEQLPEGLEGVGSLQVLQLSFNRISTLRPEDLSHLNQLKELDLKHNLITSLHPQMFQGLVQLKVLDLSFNMLTSLNPLMYFTLRNIGVDVGLGGNRWKCDCRMRSLRRRMAYDSSRGLQIWKMVCAFPSALSGRDLLQLEEDDLNCFSTEIIPEIHQDVTVYSGSEILLSCSAEDSVWWTPNGQASVSRPQAGLLISDITERDTGLYVCVSEENQVVSVFNLQISQIGGAKRKPRSVPNISRQIIPQGLNRIGELRNQTTTQSDLALAVCLSILFTFLIAFILGVLARPCIDVLWKRVTTKKRSTETHVVSSVEQRQYDNEAYSVGEEQEAVEHFRERRVTFSDVDHREENNVQYYDTVASGDQESIDNDEVFDGEAAEAKRAKRTAGDSGSDSSSLQSNQGDEQNNGRDLSGKASAGQTHNMEFEQIPESSELEKRRTMSSSSDSSQSENEVDHTTPKSPQVALDSLQQKSDLPTTGKVEVPQISIEARSEIHGFSSEPFSDWSPYKNSTDHAVLQENEDLFEFSDSTRSSSAFDSFNDSKLPVAATSDKKKSDDTSSSSSSSHVSEDEHYTVNSDNKKGDYRHDTKRPAPRPGHSFSSDSSDSDDEPVQSTVKLAGKEKLIHENDKLSSQTVTGEKDVSEKIKPMPRTKWRSVGLAVASVSKGVAPSPPARHSSTSSSDNEAQITVLKGKQNKGTVSQKKVTLNNSAPSPSSGSSSSSDSEEETTKHIRKQEQGDVYMSRPPIKVSRTVSREQETQRPAVDFEHTTSIKRHPDIKAPSISSDSSSSSDSEDETTGQTKKQRDIHVTQLPLKGSQTGSHEPETKRPALDLEYTTSIKRQVDIQAPSAPSDSSSSSDSEDETKGQTEKRRPGKFDTPQLTFQGSQTKSPDARWPTLDLQHIPRIKRRLDIKVPSQTSDSSSSSDSEEETKKFIKKQEPGNVHMPRFPIKVPQTVSHEPGTKRPAVDHQHTTSIKRHPGTKAQSASSDSSSSSDSEDDTTGHREKERPGKLNTAEMLLKKPQTKSPDPNEKWPTLDLHRIPRLKRRLDIKAPSAASDSSSSSDSEEDTKSIKKQQQGELHMSRPSVKVSQTLSRDPGTHQTLLDLEHTTPIKKRPLIKAPSASSDSSSSSDSEVETTKSTGEQEQGKLHMSRPSIKVSPTVSRDPRTQRPLLDLDHTTPIKRHPDIKVPSASSDSSSSSDSDDETGHMEKQRSGKLITTGLPLQGSQTKPHDPDAKWPGLDLRHIPRLKRRLDIKAPSPASHSSSSSDSEEERTKSIKNNGELHMSRPSVKVSQTVSRNPGTQRPLLDLEYTAPTKRHPDIKEPSPASDSSSSSDSDDETGHMEKQRSGKLITTGLPLQGSQTKPHDPDAKWPGLDLRHIPRLKRRLDIKAPSPASHSSSSSDSEEERTKSIKNSGELHMSRPSVKVSQTVSRNPGTQRPLLDLEYTAPTKRHPDIKEPSPASDSSSSSDSDDETTTHIQKPEQGNILPSRSPNKVSPTVSHEPETRWPLLDLERTTSVKQRLDIKPLSAASDSSSSSDSEDETTKHMKKQEQQPPVKLSQTLSLKPETHRPAINLEHTTSMKKQLDVKAPSASSDSSSSSDSDDETSHTEKQMPGKLITTGLPLQGSQTKPHDPDAKWPGLDLRHIPRLKRRLDIKAPSHASHSSSSSDSEEERTKSIKNNGELHMSRPSVKVSQTVSRNPGTQRPLLDLEYTAPTKRHPDIKEPSPASDSSSSSDSDDETTTHIQKPEQGNILPSSPPNKVSPTVSHEPETRWPLLDLERTTSVKRRLDIKPLSAASDSSSSSDSDDETSHMEKQRPGKLIMTGLPLQGFQRKSHDPDAKWPSLDLWHIPRLKRRLDIKAPSPASDSSSSSDSEEETTKSIKNHGELHMSRPSIKVSQTVSRNPGTQRPLLDFEYTTPIKRHPDIKEPSPASDSSSSSDSEDETTTHIKKPEQGNILPSRPPNKVSPTVIHEPETRWPLIDLERTTSAKRRLDIKPLSAASDSSSSSDSDDETTKHMKKQEQQPPVKVSQTVSLKPETQRPAINLEHTTSMKKQLDVKAPSASSDSSSTSDSDETGHMEMQRPGKLITTGLSLQGSQTKRHDSDAKWSGLDLRHIPRLKRRLDIKAPSPAFHSSSSSDSEEETTKSIKKQQQGELHMSRPSVKVSQTVSGDPGTQRPLLNLEHTSPIKRHPDIKAPSPASDSSSSSDSEDETTTSTMKKGDVHVAQLPSKMSQTASHKPETRWPLLDLEHTTSIKRRLDIKTVPSGSSSSNDSGGEQTTTYIKKQNQVELHLSRLPIEISQTVNQKPESRQPAISLEHTASIKTRQDVNAPSADSDSSSSSDSENETTGHTEKQRPGKLDIAGLPFRQSPSVDLGNITHKKQLDIKALPTQPDLGLKSVSLGSRKSESSSSTSDSEDEKRDHKAKVGAGVSVTSRVPEKDLMSFPKTPLRNIFHSPKTEHNIKLIKYTVVPDDGGNKPTNDSIHKTPEISSELQSRWATMNLGLSRSRKRLESTSQKQKSSDLPSSPPPDSPSYSGESGPGSPISRTRLKREDVGITLTGSSLIHDNKLVNASLTMKDQSDTMFGFGAPDNTKHLDIRGSEKAPATASQQQPDSSSSSDTEDERVDHKASDLSFGIPRIHRHLNIKAPSPEPSSSSSSSSESEKEVQKYSDKQSRYALKTTDSDSAITYKRAIIKTSSLPGNSLSPSGKSQSVDHANAPTSPRTAPSMSFDDMVKSRIQQSKRKTDLDLPPKLTWPGVGHHPSDLSISTPNLNTASIQPASLAEPKPPPAYTSSIKSDIKIKQDSGKSDVTIVHKHSSLRADPVSPTSRGALHKLMNLPSNTYETPRAVTEDTRERKGLKALKNMALERQKWEAEDLNRGPFSLFDGSIQPSDTSFDYRGSEADIKVLSKQPLTHLPSASIIERRATDLSYEVPHYRSHNVREPSHAIPPAIPATPPPPYEAAGLTWRPPQNTQKQVWEGKISHQQQRKSSEGSDTSSENSNSLNFDYSNAISHV